MIDVIETNGEALGQDFSMNEFAKSVQCNRYGVLYHHEFPRGVDELPIISEEAAVNMRSKLLHKHRSMSEKLLNANGDGVLFVRYGGIAEPAIAWPYLHDQGSVTEQHLNSLLTLLKQQYPNVNARLLFLWNSPFASLDINTDALDPDIYAASIPGPSTPETDWSGDAAPWTETFNAAFRQWSADLVVKPIGLDPTSLSH